jgi:hypothetical protein
VDGPATDRLPFLLLTLLLAGLPLLILCCSVGGRRRCYPRCATG